MDRFKASALVRRSVLLFVVFLLLPCNVQSASIFSSQDLGYPVRRLGSRSIGMGGAGRAMADGRSFSSANPALIASFKTSAISVLYVAQRRSVSDVSGRSESLADGDLGGIKLILPVRPGFVVGFTLEPVSDVDASVVDTAGTDQTRSEVKFSAAGGVQALGLGFGYRVGKRLQIGGRLDLMVVGTINEAWKKDFLDTRLLTSDDRVTRTFRGYQPHLGAILTRGGLSLGVAVKPSVTITEKSLRESRAIQIGLLPGEAKTETDVELPLVIGGGLAFGSSDKWMAALDVELSKWGSTGGRRKDTTEIALGVLYRTGGEDPIRRQRRHELTAGWFRRGLYFDTGAVDQIMETGASFGVSIPFRGTGMFRWVLEGGRRGRTQEHGASETFLRQTFSITGWMIRK
jgi:hypothetical protein